MAHFGFCRPCDRWTQLSDTRGGIVDCFVWLLAFTLLVYRGQMQKILLMLFAETPCCNCGMLVPIPDCGEDNWIQCDVCDKWRCLSDQHFSSLQVCAEYLLLQNT